MADHVALGRIGWLMGAVTALVIGISSIVVTVNILEAAPSEALNLSANSR